MKRKCSNCLYFKPEKERDAFEDCWRGCPVSIIENDKDGFCQLWQLKIGGQDK